MAIEVSPSERSPAMLEEASIGELVREAMDEAKELVQLEVALAREEVKEERDGGGAATLFGLKRGLYQNTQKQSHKS